MIAHLRGRLIEKHPTRVIVDVGGVGYDLSVPLSTFYTLGDQGTEVALRVHTHVREDQLALYGFATPLELAVFERLIGVSGVGPKLALAVLSGLEAAELVSALERGDVARLTTIPGIGKKTAERLCVELRDRLASLPGAAAGRPAPPPADALRADLASALVNLGYDRRAVDRAIDPVLKDHAGVPFQQLLKAALKSLSRV
jgi:Holliday junction DNA helicase RuvA